VISGTFRIFASSRSGIKNPGKNARNGRSRVSRHPGSRPPRWLAAIASVRHCPESAFPATFRTRAFSGVSHAQQVVGISGRSSAASKWIARGGVRHLCRFRAVERLRYRSPGTKRETPTRIGVPPTQPESLVNALKWVARLSRYLAGTRATTWPSRARRNTCQPSRSRVNRSMVARVGNCD
jgi:hypothetical protein